MGEWGGWSLALILALWGATVMAQDIRVIYAGNPEGSVWLGVQLGEQEANILGRFTGHTYRVEPMQPQVLRDTDMTTLPIAVVAATNAETLRQLSAKFAPLGVTVFNVTLDNDALRRACLPGVLHLPPSARMKADAAAQWRQQHPNSRVEARAWHAAFVKFAARDLNNRFRKAHGVPMDSDAWAGWTALKMTAETVARTQSLDPKTILAYLKEEMVFDGQKGMPHTFRETGQLRQPLVIVADGELAGEAPLRGVEGGLDSLGLSACAR